MSGLWYPGVERINGPSNKQWPPQIKKGMMSHSMEGSLASSLSVLLGPLKRSWTFSNAKSGRLIQHYGIDTSCYHAGSYQGNIQHISMEHEGVAGQPLTQKQIQNNINVTKWIQKVEEWPDVYKQSTRPARYGALAEHNLYKATACPSGRIPWGTILAGVNSIVEEKEKDMSIACFTIKDTNNPFNKKVFWIEANNLVMAPSGAVWKSLQATGHLAAGPATVITTAQLHLIRKQYGHTS